MSKCYFCKQEKTVLKYLQNKPFYFKQIYFSEQQQNETFGENNQEQVCIWEGSYATSIFTELLPKNGEQFIFLN